MHGARCRCQISRKIFIDCFEGCNHNRCIAPSGQLGRHLAVDVILELKNAALRHAIQTRANQSKEPAQTLQGAAGCVDGSLRLTTTGFQTAHNTGELLMRNPADCSFNRLIHLKAVGHGLRSSHGWR